MAQRQCMGPRQAGPSGQNIRPDNHSHSDKPELPDLLEAGTWAACGSASRAADRFELII
jgi:hypothetical protein